MKPLHLVALLGTALPLFPVQSAFAQDIPLIEYPASAKKNHVFKVKNIKPSWIAYWLDPAHNLKPQLLLPSGTKLPVETPAKPLFELPASIERLISVDPQNVLLVAGGSDEDLKRLQELIEVLDQPLRRVELEVQVILISDEDLKGFDLNSIEIQGKLALNQTYQPFVAQLGFARGNFQARLNSLLATGQATFIVLPRVTAINDLPITLPLSAAPLWGSATAASYTTPQPPRAGELTAEVTPTINGDETLTLLLQITSDYGKTFASSLTSVVNLRDGDTIVISGLTPLFSVHPLSAIPTFGFYSGPKKATSERNIAIFLTPRLVRLAQEKEKNPQAQP